MATPANRISLVSDVRPDGRKRRASSRQAGPEHVRHALSLPLGIIAVVGGLALGAMALPRLLAAVAVFQAQPVAERYVAGEQGQTPAEIETAAERLEFALSLAPDADTALILSDLRLWQARRATDPKVLDTYAKRAADAARVAVRNAPAHPAAWVALAEALDLAAQGDSSVALPLARALEVAPYDPRRRGTRVELALRYWQALTPAAQRAAGPQILALAYTDINALAKMAKRNLGLGPVRDALAGDPALAQRFDGAYVAQP